MLKKIIAFICVFFTIVGCTKKSPEELEQEVLDDVFIKLVDLTYKDLRIYSAPPLPGQDSTAEFFTRIKFLEADTLGLVLAIGHNRDLNFQKYSNKKFHFKNLDEFHREEWMSGYPSWKNKYDKFVGAMSFSEIKFNKKGNKGKIEVSYSCGGNCGIRYDVYLEKINDMWIISKVAETGIS